MTTTTKKSSGIEICIHRDKRTRWRERVRWRYTSRQSFIRFIFHHHCLDEKQEKFQFSKLFSSGSEAVHVSSSSSSSYIRHCIALGLKTTFLKVKSTYISWCKINSIILIPFQMMDPARLESLRVMKKKKFSTSLSFSTIHPHIRTSISKVISPTIYFIIFLWLAQYIWSNLYVFLCQHIYLHEWCCCVHGTLYSAVFLEYFSSRWVSRTRQNFFLSSTYRRFTFTSYSQHLRRYVFSI